MPPASEEPSLDRSVRRLLDASFTQVAERYYREVEIGPLAIHALNGLSRIDPSVSVARIGGMVQLTTSKGPMAAFAAPGNDDPAQWAALGADVVSNARASSSALAVAENGVLLDAMMANLVERLDEFSRYSNAEEAAEERGRRVGFGGIGVQIHLVGKVPEIISVMPDTPAAGAKLRPSDRITHVDESLVIGLALREVVDRMRGSPSTSLVITLERPDHVHSRTVKLTRQRIVPMTVTSEAKGNILYLRVAGFNQDTTDEVESHIDRRRKEMGDRLRGIVLDLRDNMGGLLEQAVKVSDLFLTKGRIVTTRGRHPDSYQEFEAEDDDVSDGLPLVVLINGNTASASEIVAAALQDHGRAVLIGSNSYGKGTVQTIATLPNDGELILTWSHFYAPSGYGLHQLGVLPTLCTSGVAEGPAAVLAMLRQTRGTVSETLRKWRGLKSADSGEGRSLRALCPVDRNMRPIDAEVAERLFADQSLYRQALVMSYPEVAGR